jgi:hypothetical protein
MERRDFLKTAIAVAAPLAAERVLGSLEAAAAAAEQDPATTADNSTASAKKSCPCS